jgi:hypothetical protein
MENRGKFSDRRKTSINAPRFTSNSPQLHHKNTTQKQPFSQKTLEKRPSHHAQKNTARQSPDRISHSNRLT